MKPHLYLPALLLALIAFCAGYSVANHTRPTPTPIVIIGPQPTPLPVPEKANMSRLPRYSDHS